MNIRITKMNSGFQVYVQGAAQHQAHGRSKEEAIGTLVAKNPLLFNVNIHDDVGGTVDESRPKPLPNPNHEDHQWAPASAIE